MSNYRRVVITRNISGQWMFNGEVTRIGIAPQQYRASTGVGVDHKTFDQWRQWIADYTTYKNGELINMRTITIELRFDADEEDKHQVLKDAAMQAAKHLFTSALLISTKRKPQIAMYTADMFAGQEEISLADDLTSL